MLKVKWKVRLLRVVSLEGRAILDSGAKRKLFLPHDKIKVFIFTFNPVLYEGQIPPSPRHFFVLQFKRR